MHITEIGVFSYKANYSHGVYTMSGGRTSTGEPSLVVLIRTDNGIEGWADNAPLGSDYLPNSFTGEIAALKELGPRVLGLDPRSPGAVSVPWSSQRSYGPSHDIGHGGQVCYRDGLLGYLRQSRRVAHPYLARWLPH
jgi:L-alanine-DL-glutamate epimerase-like enolase superfamily enzyme